MKGIYAIRNTLNGRHYVGSTSVSIAGRFKSHKHQLRHGKHHSPALQRSWKKNGESVFEFIVLEVVENLDSILEREQHWIEELKAADSRAGYNVAKVAGTRAGVPQPEEMKERYRQERKGVPKSAEHRRKISEGQKGRQISQEQREKLRVAATKQWADPQARADQSERKKGKPSAFKGKTHTTESIEKFRAAAMTERRLAISMGNLPEMTDEIRAKISASKKGQRKGIPRIDIRSPTPELIAEMKRLRETGMPYAKIAAKVGKDVSTVHRYVNR